VQTRRPLSVLVGAVLLVIGVEALRRITRREFPDAADVPPGAAFRGLVRRGGEAAPPPPSDHVTELERLARLRDAGVLTDDELTAEKARLLGSAP
jgi:putative oligomerization/nucleic acid binding protein